MSDWTTITTAIGATLSGERTEDAGSFWNAGTKRCPLIMPTVESQLTYLADTETELAKEIAWDEFALREHGFLKDDELAPLGIPSVNGLRPSLHLNLADGYHCMGDNALAREHLTEGQTVLWALKDDGYGKMIRAGLDNLVACRL